jgi:hypothetical protein
MPTGINVRNWSGGTSWVLDSNCTLSLEVINGGGQTFLSSGANIELRGRFRSSTFTLSGSGTIQQVGTCGPITISGTAVTTIRLYGVRADLTNTSVGTTVVDQCVTEQKISILSTSSEITDVRSDISGVKSDTESAAVMLEDVSDRIPIRLVNGRMNSQVSAVRNGMVEDEDDDVSPEIITQLSDITTGLFDEDIYNGVSTLTSTCTELRLAELDQANIPADIAAISGVDPQDIRDAMKLAPTAGAPESGSVDAIISSTASICTEPRLSQLDNDYLPTAVYATRAQVNEIELDTANIQARIPAALVNGRTPADVGSMQDNVITANKIATDAITAAKVSADAVTKIQTGLATAAAVSNSQNTYTLVTAIKAIVDLLPDAGALTSIAKEATVGSPAGASIAADIAEVLSSLGVTDDRLTDETSGLGALKSVVEAVPTEMLASTIDGSADFAIAMKKILAYCTGIIVRTGSVYAYRDYDNTANALVLTGTADGRTRF